RHCVELTFRQTRTVALVVGLSAIAFWPLDYVLYSDEVVAAFRMWRVPIIALSIITLAATTWWPDRIRARVYAFLVLILTLGSAAAGYGFSAAGSLDSAWFHTAYLLPVMTAIMMVGLGRRVVAASAMCGAFAMAYFAGRPDQLVHPALVATCVFTAFALAGCI